MLSSLASLTRERPLAESWAKGRRAKKANQIRSLDALALGGGRASLRERPLLCALPLSTTQESSFGKKFHNWRPVDIRDASFGAAKRRDKTLTRRPHKLLLCRRCAPALEAASGVAGRAASIGHALGAEGSSFLRDHPIESSNFSPARAGSVSSAATAKVLLRRAAQNSRFPAWLGLQRCWMSARSQLAASRGEVGRWAERSSQRWRRRRRRQFALACQATIGKLHWIGQQYIKVGAAACEERARRNLIARSNRFWSLLLTVQIGRAHKSTRVADSIVLQLLVREKSNCRSDSFGAGANPLPSPFSSPSCDTQIAYITSAQ